MAREKSSLQYAIEWRRSLKFIDMSYSDFIDFLLNSKKKMYFSEKIDGMLSTMVFEKNKDPFFLTKSGDVYRRDYPVLREYKKILDDIKNIDSIVIAGELKALHNGIQYPFNQSQSIVQTGDINKVKHFAFDIYKLNGKDIRSDFPTLEKFFGNKKFIKIPRWVYGNIEEFEKLWKQIVEVEHGEGIIACDPSQPKLLYRIKNIMTVDVVVIGAGNINGKAWAKGQIGYLKLALMDENNNFILTTKLGTGFNKPQKIDLFEFVYKNKIEEKDEEIWIPPTLIVEIKYRRYRFSKLPLLHFNGKKYITIGEGDGVMMDQASFFRFRDDKKVDYKDLSKHQFPIK